MGVAGEVVAVVVAAAVEVEVGVMLHSTYIWLGHFGRLDIFISRQLPNGSP